MGLEWDPEGDRERSRESRSRILTAAVITTAVLGFVAVRIKQNLNERHVESLPQGATSEPFPSSRESSDPGHAAAPAVSPALRARLVTLVCAVAREHAGELAALDGRSPTPNVDALNALVREINNASAAADLVQQAMATCP